MDEQKPDDEINHIIHHVVDDHDEHDTHAQHRMNDNGFGAHPDLHEQAESRFTKAALAFCYHRVSGQHQQCLDGGIDCPYDLGLMDAYRLYVTT